MENQSKLVSLLESEYLEAKTSVTQDISDILMAGLNWETNYWIDLALDWLEQGCEISDECAARLIEISDNNSLPQKTRHRALAFHRKWQRV